ncbi:MAG: hybrid sensor histidine kinase/response regulator [Methylophilus sp.]|uniref:hybrid sensor histidine kinase/response regulator n=1 Tax=Methylophilus sp. TaxID=29541 RepID=UPI003F9F6304
MEENKVSYLKLVNSPLKPGDQVIPSELSDTLRNMMGLLALPGLWVGRSGQAILKLTFEAIERTLPIRFIYSEVQLEPNVSYASLMWGHQFESGHQLGAWQSVLNDLKVLPMQEAKPYAHALRGETLQLIKLRLGYGPTAGTIWFGSEKPDFPSLTDLAFIRAAITLAGTGILTARAQQETERANRAKDEFMAILGHELRNPLAPIMMSLDILKIKNKGDLPNELQIIDRQAKHLAQLVDDLLDISRITAGKTTLNNDLVDLYEVLARAIENCTPLLNEKRHHFSKSLSGEHPHFVRGDAYRLIQIFSNLLNNAAKFMGEGGHIYVSSMLSGNMIEIAIQDQGPGIPAELLPNIFNMFEQGRQTLERSQGGLGIGLSVVKSLVELHHGRVQVESVEGHGAKFSVLLPIAHDADPMEVIAEKSIHTVSPKKILLVDDNVDAVQTLAEYLELIGYVTTTATHPNDALLVMPEFDPDIVILDIGLPGMTGYELATLIKKNARQAPFMIALTGYGQQKDITMSKQAGFDIHLTKPIALEALEEALSNLDDQPM